MIRLIIPFDDEDENRGEYFNESQLHFTSKINHLDNIYLELINAQKSWENSIDYFTSKFNGNPFILIGYLHGKEDALLIDNQSYISSVNAYLFSETLFYACSCLSAHTLGQQLIDNGCKVFLGFNTTISSARNETESIFYYCENIFLIRFLTTEESVQECLRFMYDEYLRMQNYLLKYHGIFDASILEDNLKSFVVKYDVEESELLNKNYFDK